MNARPCPAREGGSGARMGNTVAVYESPIPIAYGIGLDRVTEEMDKMVRRRVWEECEEGNVQRNPKFSRRMVMNKRHYAHSHYQQNCIKFDM
jgi:hypothetical protein